MTPKKIKTARCSRSGKLAYLERHAADAAAMSVLLRRRTNVVVYPCVAGGWHVSTEVEGRCK